MGLRFYLVAYCLTTAFCFSQSGPNQTAPETQPSAQVTTRDGSMRDIGAIGTRNLGCGRGFGNWYSLDRQAAMGKEYSDQIEATSKLVKDPAIVEYVNRIGQKLVRNSDSQVPFHIKVIESDDVNAFAL